MSRTDLTEKQWRQLAPHLPPNPRRGHTYVEHRHVVNGILWRLRTGAPWRDIPPRYGPWQTCYDRFIRWSRNGTWQRLLKVMQVAADEAGLIDWDGAMMRPFRKHDEQPGKPWRGLVRQLPRSATKSTARSMD